MDMEFHKDVKFYLCTILGFSLMTIGIFCPPVGTLELHILYGGAFFLILAGTVEGLDVKGIIRELRLLKDTNAKLLNNNENS